ncbi:hypothetical protein [Bifidobacterium pseudocatenulatum]|uniref:hypothetical protein n=1 Tax=Bifidobacterium pseudocatenulatum TaxID=28026 RepID=UPI0022E80761|nr:hypothetical protein [Bifidobacterium pseudocatenulatum]
MAFHVELNPDDNVLGLSLGMKAMRLALTQKTHKVGTVRIPTGGNTDVIIGDGAQDGANRIDRDGNQLPLVDTSGIDKAAQDARKAADDAAAKADEAIKQGEQIRQDAQAGIDDARKQAQYAAAKADKARSDLQAEMDANKQAADNAIANVDKKADKAQSDLEAQTAALKSSIANVDAKAEQVKADASKISQRVDADKAALDKSIASVDAKAQAASDKGDRLAGQISDVTTTVNGHTTKLDELSTRIEGVASDGQVTVKSLTSLQQTVTGLSSTVTQNTKTASDAMSKASQVEQTANSISANLSKNYTTTADADEKYAAKTELKATADGLQANITRSQQTADGAVTAANKAQATADGFGATLSKDYQTAKASDEKYSTKAELKATSDGLSSSLSSVKQTADGAVTAASKAQQTADVVSLNLSKNYATKSQADATYATQTSLKATSDSLTASINSTAKTAQSSVDKATNLEANLNGIKTTVSQTYTTKTEFANLSIGGTNRIVLSGGVAGRIDMSGDSGSIDTGTHWTSAYVSVAKAAYVLSSDIKVEGNTYVSVAFYDMDKKCISRPTGAMTNLAAPWSRILTVPTNAAYMRASFPTNQKGHIKLEKGTKPTDWSPAPEDLQPAGDYATNSSLTQTANSITAQVTEVSKTATSAMNKSTTVEQTANGLSTRITAQGKTLDATTKTANEAKSTADSNKQTISQVKTTADGAVSRVSSLEQNLDGFESTVAKTYQPKDGMSAYATTSALKQTSDSITAQVAEVSKTASGAMSKATTVEQTANGLSTRITEQAKTLDATVKTANEAKSTADSNKTTISQTSNLVNAALAGDNLITDGGFESTAWWMGLKAPFRLSVGSFYHGAHVLVCDAATGDNRCPLTHAKGMAGTATAITVTKGRTYRLSGYCVWYGSVPSNVNPGVEKLRLAKPDGTYIADAQCGKSTSWAETHVDWKCPDDGSITSVRIEVMHQANGTIMWDDVSFRDITEAAATSTRVASVEQNLNGFKTSVADTYQPKSGMGSYATTSQLTQTANQIRGEVSEKYQSKNGMSSYATTSALTQKADEITGKVAEVAKTASGAMGKASSVEQTASALSSKLSETVRTLDSTVQTVNTVKSTTDSNKATLTQVAKTASDASSRASSVEQNLNGFKTTVSQTYGRGSNLWVNPTFDPDKPQITSLVDNVTAPNGSGVNLLASRDHYNGATSFPVVPGHTYVITAHAKKIKGDISLKAGIWYTAQTSGNAWDSIVHAESTSNLSDGWMAATWRFTCPNSKSRGCVYFQIDQWHNSLTTQWYVANVVCVDVTGLQPAGDYATKSYVNQNAKTIALGVVENYKGSDGSGLATKSDITASNKSITNTVASTYATKSGVTQEISSKITQNNNSLDVKFATKNETKTAQATANAAKSDASDAQSRVGTLEDCISLTSAGVRAGHQKNGVFNGVSALVNTDGSFDLLDASGNLLTRINQHRFQVTGDDGTGGGYLSLSQDGINITVQPSADTSKTYHIQVGKSGVGITAPDGSSIQCSVSGGLNIETVKYGKISIGAGGLQFTNDQGWGLRLSAAGWSLKWAGNHTLATGPAAGKLYIDGREIVTK